MTTSTTNLTPASPADNIFLPSSRASGRVIQGRTRATQCGFFAGGCFEPYLRISSALGTTVALSSVAVEHVLHSGTVQADKAAGRQASTQTKPIIDPCGGLHASIRCHLFHHRDHRGVFWLRRYREWRNRNREDPVLH